MTGLQRFTGEATEYREIRRTFWGLATRDSKSWGGYYRARLCTIYRHLIPEGARVLEIGCGGGDLLAAVKPAVGVGIDFSPEILDGARTAHPALHFVLADAHALTLEPQIFDYVVLSDIVNDLWDVQTMLGRFIAIAPFIPD